MKITLQSHEYDFMLSVLKHIDKKSYDPVYKNLSERIEKTSSKIGNNQRLVAIEESEVFVTIDALNEYIDDAQTGNYKQEEKKDRTSKAEDFIQIIASETGIR